MRYALAPPGPHQLMISDLDGAEAFYSPVAHEPCPTARRDASILDLLVRETGQTRGDSDQDRHHSTVALTGHPRPRHRTGRDRLNGWRPTSNTATATSPSSAHAGSILPPRYEPTHRAARPPSCSPSWPRRSSAPVTLICAGRIVRSRTADAYPAMRPRFRTGTPGRTSRRRHSTKRWKMRSTWRGGDRRVGDQAGVNG